ncbi:MAG TPA: hypothetical protein VIV12_30095 [Streptosporangiaceae bacterium]
MPEDVDNRPGGADFGEPYTDAATDEYWDFDSGLSDPCFTCRSRPGRHELFTTSGTVFHLCRDCFRQTVSDLYVT